MFKKDQFISSILEAISETATIIDSKTINNFLEYFEMVEGGHYQPKLVSVDMGDGRIRHVPKVTFVEIESIRIRRMKVRYSTDVTFNNETLYLTGSNGLKKKGVNVDVEMDIETGHTVEAIERLKHDLLDNINHTRKEKD